MLVTAMRAEMVPSRRRRWAQSNARRTENSEAIISSVDLSTDEAKTFGDSLVKLIPFWKPIGVRPWHGRDLCQTESSLWDVHHSEVLSQMSSSGVGKEFVIVCL